MSLLLEPTMTAIERGAFFRFWDRVLVGDGCWEWQGKKNDQGYGLFSLKSVWYLAHRIAYEDRVGPIPEGLVLDHVKERGCTSRSCVNPSHLEPVTQVENNRRAGQTTLAAANAAKTHCPAGHPYDEANTYVDRKGGRNCRLCHNEKSRVADRREYMRLYMHMRKRRAAAR